MAGLHQIISHGARGHSGLHGARAVSGRNAGGHALGGFNGHGKRGALFVAIAHCHGWQLEQFAAFAGQGQANQAPAKAGHEVDGLRRDVVGGEHQVAFVFTVFFVHQDDDFSGAHVGHDVLDGRNGHGLGGEGRGGHRTTFANSGGNSGANFCRKGGWAIIAALRRTAA